jgi:uncharacterized Zn finger protein
MAWWERDHGFFEPSRPRPAKGGIRARSQRGAFGESWWARRWVAVLEGFDLGARLRRGRSYARRGQVLDVAVEPGLARARVQGSRPDPYAVTIRVRRLSAAEWMRVAVVFAQEMRFGAKLLAGEMPEDIEKAFEGAGLSLFPARRQDLATECSCPDWSNPCKHIAAVYYLLGEEFDRDPFLIFKLRGLTREELVRLLGSARGAALKGRAPLAAAEGPEPAAAPPSPLRSDIESFWRGGDLPADPFGDVPAKEASAVLLLRLGPLPFWRGARSLTEALEPVYARASSRGLDLLARVSGAMGTRSG